MSEVRFGSSPDFSKNTRISNLAETLRRNFTVEGAKQDWYEKHKGRVENFKRIESQLTAEQRQHAIDQMNKDANIGAAWKLGKNLLGLTSVFGAVLLGGKLAVSSEFRHQAIESAKKIKIKDWLNYASTRAKDSWNAISARFKPKAAA